MGLLDGQIAKAIYSGFRGKLQRGTLWRPVTAASGGLDARGDPIVLSPLSWACQGFQDEYSDVYKVTVGIPITDVRINLFAASLPSGIAPQKDDKVHIAGQWWQLRKVTTDPAKALWIAPGFACKDPTS